MAFQSGACEDQPTSEKGKKYIYVYFQDVWKYDSVHHLKSSTYVIVNVEGFRRIAIA